MSPQGQKQISLIEFYVIRNIHRAIEKCFKGFFLSYYLDIT